MLSFSQGRALLNAIGNLELSGPYAEALRKLGHNLEDVASQVNMDCFIYQGALFVTCCLKDLKR